MIFQLDENMDDDDFVQACTKEGKAGLWHFPKKFKKKRGGAKDPEILPYFMSRDKPLLTNDIEIAEEHSQCIPNLNPGLVIVCYSKSNPRTATSRGLQAVIRKFKVRFPQWSHRSYANSILKLTETDATVWHVTNGELKYDGHVSFSELKWLEELCEVLDRNALRNQLN